MKRVLLAAAVVIAVYAGYRVFFSSGPVKAYETFAEEILHRRYDAAASLSEGLTAADLEQLGTQERIGAGPPMFQTLFPSKFAIESQTKSSDGKVTIAAMQTVLFNPAGVESALRPAMYANVHQVVELKRAGGGWKVVSFKNDFVKMDELARR